jgi:hypothetical protein
MRTRHRTEAPERMTFASPIRSVTSRSVTAAAAGPDRLDVYAQGRDGKTWHRWWDGTRWVPWEQR